MSTITDFHVDLARSQTPALYAAVWKAISKCFPEALALIPSHTENDKLGVDYWIEFAGGKMEALDVKIRSRDYFSTDNRTACLELIANTNSGKLGWPIDPTKRTDWILFYYADTGRYVLYHARELRAAVLAYLPHLKSVGKPFTTRTKSGSGSYDSTGIIVSHSDLKKCVSLNSRSRPQACDVSQ